MWSSKHNKWYSILFNNVRSQICYNWALILANHNLMTWFNFQRFFFAVEAQGMTLMDVLLLAKELVLLAVPLSWRRMRGLSVCVLKITRPVRVPDAFDIVLVTRGCRVSLSVVLLDGWPPKWSLTSSWDKLANISDLFLNEQSNCDF